MSLRKRLVSLVMMGTFATLLVIPGTIKNESSLVLAASKYTVNSSINRYTTAEDAANGENSVGTYSAGEYYIYKQAEGMLNISKVEGGPGSWINPSEGGSYTEETEDTAPVAEDKAPVVEEKTQAESKEASEAAPAAGDYTLYSATKVYLTAFDAMNGGYSNNTYPAGNYYIYKSYNGMINISRTPGHPGAWINPGGSYETTPTPPKTTTPTVTTPKTTAPAPSDTVPAAGEKYVVTSSLTKYSNAADAANKVNSIGTYPAGTYYIFKTYNGMVNVTKTPGVPGAWVNPGTVTAVPSPTTTTPKTTTPVSKPATTTPTVTKPASTTPAKAPSVGDAVVIDGNIPKYSNAGDAANKANSIGSYPSGTYYVYKIYDGMINISKTPELPGAWVNLGNPVISDTKPGTGSEVSVPKAGTSISEFAKQFVGEDGKRFYTWYGLTYRDEWCAMFVSYVGNKTGNSSFIPKYSYVDHFKDYYKKGYSTNVNNGYKPTKDMLIVFDYEPNGIGNHIGIVSGADDKYVYTVEGNTGNDEVKEKKYLLTDTNIMGYLLPGYPGATVNGKAVPGGAYLKKLTY